MSTDMAGWTGAAWLSLLACTGALVCVALLRRPCRRWFGAENAFLLWMCPPAAMLASQLPHWPTAGSGILPGIAWVSASVTGAWSDPYVVGVDGQDVLTWVWLIGAAGSLARAVVAQGRYRRSLRGAVPLAGVPVPWPVLRAGTVDTGPALVGAWHPRIVVPADFEERYSATEQALIIAHEAMHARRRDGWWSLLARLSASLLWFHPLVWWALAAVRHDQELACDAAVLRERGGCRRSYVLAMLKTPTTMQVLPVGCSWSSRHPLTERIAMLKQPSRSTARRRAGAIVCLSATFVLAGAAYASSTPAAAPTRPSDTARQYQLDIQVTLAGGDAEASHVRRLKVALCNAPGRLSTAAAHGIELDAAMRVLAGERVGIDLAVREKAGAKATHTHLEGAPDQPLQATGTVPGGDVRYALDITPRRGCPASATAAALGGAPISMRVDGRAARQVAEWIASQANFALINPQALDERKLALHFQGVPAASAMRMVAHADGMRAVFEGARVRFEPET